MSLTIALDREWFDANRERFLRKCREVGGEEDTYWLDLGIGPIDELMVDGEGELNMSLSSMGDEAYVGVRLPLTVKTASRLLRELAHIFRGEGIVIKEAKPSGTGSVVYVPKRWEGKTVIAVCLG